jgi:hypothetical protein
MAWNCQWNIVQGVDSSNFYTFATAVLVSAFHACSSLVWSPTSTSCVSNSRSVVPRWGRNYCTQRLVTYISPLNSLFRFWVWYSSFKLARPNPVNNYFSSKSFLACAHVELAAILSWPALTYLTAEKTTCNYGFVFDPAPLIPLVAKVILPIIDIWTSYCHTVRNHACSWGQLCIYSLLHNNVTDHSTH